MGTRGGPRLCSPFGDLAELQYATVLSEAVYARGAAAMHDAVRRLSSVLGLMHPLSGVTIHDAAGQRYMVGHTAIAMYVAFQGTKQARDWAANLSFPHVTMGHASGDSAKPPAAHGGFSGRSLAVPLESLYSQAAATGKRLVLCGHSLGGAVALLCTVKLLRVWAARELGGAYARAAAAGEGWGGELSGQQLAAAAAAAAVRNADPGVRCITFAAPAVANEALAAEVVAAGWDRYIANFVQPEDIIVPFVNKLLKAKAGSVALERTLTRLATCHAAAAAAAAAAARGRQAAGRGDSLGGIRAGSLVRALASGGGGSGGGALGGGAGGGWCICGAPPGSAGGFGSALFGGGRLGAALRAYQSRRGRPGSLLALTSLLSRAATAAACAAASLAAAAAAAAQGGTAELHSRLLHDSACRHTAAVVSLAMASAVDLPAAETLGNAPHPPEAARRLRRTSDSMLTYCDAGLHGALMPARQLQAGLATAELVAAAEAGVIGLCEGELAELDPEARARVGGEGWLTTAPAARRGAADALAAKAAAAEGWGRGGGPPCGAARGAPGAAAWDVGRRGESELEHERRVDGARRRQLLGMRRTNSAFECAMDAKRAGVWGLGIGAGSGGGGVVGRLSSGGDSDASSAIGVAPDTGMASSASEASSIGSFSGASSGDEDDRSPRRRRVAWREPEPAAAAAAAAAAVAAPRGQRLAAAAAAAAPAVVAACAPWRGVAGLESLRLRASMSFTRLSSPYAPHLHAWQQQQAALVHARAAALLQRRGPTLRDRFLWNACRAAGLAAPKLLTAAAAAALPLAASLSSLLPRALVSALAPPIAAAAPLAGAVLPLLLALPPAAVVFEVVCALIVVFVVPRTYTIGTQWVLTKHGLEPALRRLEEYPRDWASLRPIGGLFPGHRMVAYRDRLGKLLPGERLRACPSYRAMDERASAAAAAAAAAAAEAADAADA
ncbi:triacylglycerol lipase [Raphidocelis subcapitata]|uniref:Triacylglycerol lipase n=1 Tax=Raphidocelis subcapitata TaxID=307507 RepID=A0A2V0P6S0_9CHLO|nr:triacylglycerol lipase [Raphidocelis subcapitata]|eukprot:GBF95558.1 triacylglycerol lipase [Raphidocelis subcapitata]